MPCRTVCAQDGNGFRHFDVLTYRLVKWENHVVNEPNLRNGSVSVCGEHSGMVLCSREGVCAVVPRNGGVQ
jgi:hypothetical protein